jgi:ABC-type nickel/cobalt efflux system permease component RcnA
LDRNSVFYQDNNFSGRAGWKEIIVLGSEGISIQSASVPSTDRSNELSDYPVDVLSSPPQEIEATFSFSKNQPSDILTTSGTLIMPQESGEYLQPSNANSRRFADAFTELISNKELSFEVILFALATAFGLGAFHALSPGHGKTVVAAYLVGSRGTASHALFLGMIVTLTHTIGVFILGLVTLYASKYIVPDKLYPWLGFFSGLTIVAIGTTLFVKRYRRLYGSHSHAHNNERAHVHAHAFAHSQGHDHGHSHTHGNEHAHAHALAHSHVPDHDHSRTHAWVHSHSHESDQGHSHSHDPDHAHSHEQSSRHSHFHDYFDHDHSDHGHHHTFDSGKEGVSLGSLFALGVSGGIVPCPSALVVLLSAISLHRIGFGLVLIVAFSLGLALVLTGIGLLMVYAKQFMDRFNGEGTVVQRLPLLSSIIITILGFGIAIQALVSGGIIQINLL